MHVHGNAAAVVRHRDTVVLMHHHVDFVAKSSKGFIDRIVDHFPDQVMQPHLAGRADIHRGPQSHGFEPAENLDRGSVVTVSYSTIGCNCFFGHVVHTPANSSRKALSFLMAGLWFAKNARNDRFDRHLTLWPLAISFLR